MASLNDIAPYNQEYALSERVVKGEDAVLACKLDQGPLTGSWLYAVTDGHAGKSCVEFITSHLVPQLLTRSKDIPNITLDQFHSDVLRKHAEGLQAALCDTFVSLHNQFCETGDLSGATLTVAILSCYGRLLTLCNVGDSEAIIDTGLSIFEATSSHRIHDMLSEQERLKKAGYTVAALGVHLAGPAKEGEPSIGPLRVWPGGLCPSRSIGDVDAGPGVVPVPHIRQIVVPNQGCRLIIASDGLWDNCSHSKAAATCRNLSPEDAANALCAIGSSQNARVRDDCSVIVVDILNPRHGRGKERTFAQVASSLNAPLKPPKPMNLGSTFMSFLKNAVAPAPQLDNIPYSHTLDSGPGHLIPLYDVDCINAYYPPDITNGLVKSWLEAIMAKQSVSVKALSSRGELLTQLSSQYTDAGTASFPSLDSTMSSRLSESGIVAGQSLPVDDVAVTKDGELNQGMNLTRLKSVTQYRSNQKAIADKDLKSKLKEGTNTAVEMPTLPEFDNVDIDHDDLDDDDEEDESYDFARDAAKEAASLAVQAALDRANARAVQSSTQGKALSDSSVHDETSSPSTARMPVPPSLPLQSKPGSRSGITRSSSLEVMSELAKALCSQRHVGCLQLLNKAVTRGSMGAYFILSNADDGRLTGAEGDSSYRGVGSSNAGDEDRSTHCKMDSEVTTSGRRPAVPSWLLPSEDLDERDRLCPDLLLVDQLPRMVAQWDPESVPILLKDHPLHHKIIIVEVEHCQCGIGPSTDLFVDSEAQVRKKGHASLHNKLSAAGLTVNRFQLDVGCEMCGETNQNLTKLLRNKMGVDALRASDCTQRLHRHSTQFSHRLLHHFQSWRALLDPTSPDKRLASSLPFFGAAASGNGPAFPSPLTSSSVHSLVLSISDPSLSNRGEGSHTFKQPAINSQSQVHARRELVKQNSKALANPFMSPLVNKSSDLDRKLRLDEAPPEYPRIQPKTARDKVKSWSGKESHGEEEEEEENEVDKKALQEVDLSRESFLAAMREDPH